MSSHRPIVRGAWGACVTVLALTCVVSPPRSGSATGLPAGDEQATSATGNDAPKTPAAAPDAASKGLPGSGFEPAQAEGAAEPLLTRRALWRRLRLARRDHLRPHEAGLLERNFLALQKAERPSILDLNFWGFYPRAETLSRGSNLGFGLRYWTPRLAGSGLSLHASSFFSLRGYELYDFQLGLVPHGKGFPRRSSKGDDLYELGQLGRPVARGLILYSSLRYRHLPDEDFFGLGPDSQRSDHSSFLLQDASYEMVAGYQFGHHVSVTLRPGFLQAFVDEGRDEERPATQERFTESEAPGLTLQPDFFRLGAAFFADFRDEPGNPHKGAMLALSYERYDDDGGQNAYRFNRWAADARVYLPLGSTQRVLALRAWTSIDDPDPGTRVPFYLQTTLGGSHTLRGFNSFRFRGEKVLLLQAEYRWEASPAIELAVFADAGAVAAPGAALDRFEVDYGVGLRFKTHGGPLFRLDWAKGEVNRLLARFSNAF